MITLDQLRHQGFELRLVLNKLFMDPLQALTELQRQWLLGYVPQIRQQLLKPTLAMIPLHFARTCNSSQGRGLTTDTETLEVIEPLEHHNELLRGCMGLLCHGVRVLLHQQGFQTSKRPPNVGDPNPGPKH